MIHEQFHANECCLLPCTFILQCTFLWWINDGLRVSLAYYEDKWLSREILQNPYDKSLFERTNACTDRHKVNKLKNNVCLILLIIKTLHWMPELDYHMHICIEGITFHYHIVCTFILKTITRYKIKYKSSIFYRLKIHKTLQYFDSSLSRNKHSNSICSQHHLLLIMYRMQLQ